MLLRTEMFYKNHEAYSTSNPHSVSGIVNSDVVSTLLALDLDSVYAPWLTETGVFSANFEFKEDTILDASDYMLQAAGNLTKVHKHETTFLASVSTSWYWNAIQPAFASIYNPDGTTFILEPTLVMVPPWTNKYFAKIG
jgi:hypothetical protein